MKIVTSTYFRQHLIELMDKVTEDHAPVLVIRRNGTPAVLISIDDFSGYDETDYLLATSTNATRLEESLTEINKAEGHRSNK